VDADYTQKPHTQWKAADWPRQYHPTHSNLFAAGIAFAPPHPISQLRMNSQGLMISPAPSRTSTPSAMIGQAVARSILDMMMLRGSKAPTHTASMAEMGAACIASAEAKPVHATAASPSIPLLPTMTDIPQFGRDINCTFGEGGLAGHWIKILLHHMFLYKAGCGRGWPLIPE
jgi:sulfide:quinone oxidoreductase